MRLSGYICILYIPKKYLFLLAYCFGLTTRSYSQFYEQKNWGINVGYVFALGNKFQRNGFSIQTYYYSNFVQVNAEARFYYNYKNLGPKKNYGEIVTSAGLVLAYGKKQNFVNPFLSPVSNQTGYKNSVGYSFNAYFTPRQIRTKQQTGTLAFQFGNFSLLNENDILARKYLDRFRTGAFLLQWQFEDKMQAGLNCTMWTGQMGREIRDNKSFPHIGYIDTTGGIYTNISHGLLSVQAKYNLGYGQNVQANLGIDAEQVRNAIQNRLIHDMIIIPRKWFKPINCHIPMLDTEGKQYLYQPGQKIRKPELYFNMFTGAGNFY